MVGVCYSIASKELNHISDSVYCSIPFIMPPKSALAVPQLPTRRSTRNTTANPNQVLSGRILHRYPNERLIRQVARRDRARRLALGNNILEWLSSPYSYPEILRIYFACMHRISYRKFRMINREIHQRLPAWNPYNDPVSVADPYPVRHMQVSCTNWLDNGRVARLLRCSNTERTPGNIRFFACTGWVKPLEAENGMVQLKGHEIETRALECDSLRHIPHFVCSQCVTKAYLMFDFSRHHRSRIMPLCHTHSLSLRNTYNVAPWYGRVPECRCHVFYKPHNLPPRFWLCYTGRLRLNRQQWLQAYGIARLDFDLAPRPNLVRPRDSLRLCVDDGDLVNRNHCHCGVDYQQIINSYSAQPVVAGPLLPGQADNPDIFRFCLVCQGHVPKPFRFPNNSI